MKYTLLDLDIKDKILDVLNYYEFSDLEYIEFQLKKNLSFSTVLYNVKIEDVKIQNIDDINFQIFIKTDFKNFIYNFNKEKNCFDE